MIGNTCGITGICDNTTARVFSEGTRADETPETARARRFTGGEDDSPARNLARTIDRMADLYIRNLDVRMVYRLDRFGRGGHHAPFSDAGFPAVRIMETNEHYDRQHQDVRTEDGRHFGDTVEFVDWDYAAKLTALNAVVLAGLAGAPGPPHDVRLSGAVQPSTTLRWTPPPGAAASRVWWRLTTEPTWTHSVTVPGTSRATTRSRTWSWTTSSSASRASRRTGARARSSSPAPSAPSSRPVPASGRRRAWRNGAAALSDSRADAAVQGPPSRTPMPALSPADLVLLAPDRFASTSPRKSDAHTRLDGAGTVAESELAQSVLLAALLTLERDGHISLTRAPKKELLGLRKTHTVHAARTSGSSTALPGPTEATLLAAVPEAPVEIDEVVYRWLGDDTPNPDAMLLGRVCHGLVERGLVERTETTTKKWFFTNTDVSFSLPEATRAAVAAADVSALSALVTDATGRPDLVETLRIEIGQGLRRRVEAQDYDIPD